MLSNKHHVIAFHEKTLAFQEANCRQLQVLNSLEEQSWEKPRVTSWNQLEAIFASSTKKSNAERVNRENFFTTKWLVTDVIFIIVCCAFCLLRSVPFRMNFAPFRFTQASCSCFIMIFMILRVLRIFGDEEGLWPTYCVYLTPRTMSWVVLSSWCLFNNGNLHFF